MSYFFLLRHPLGPAESTARCAIPATARGAYCSQSLGKAVDRNRIKRRMREAVRRQLTLLRTPVDVVLHPRRSVIDLEFATLEREVAAVFRAIQRASEQVASPPPARDRAPPWDELNQHWIASSTTARATRGQGQTARLGLLSVCTSHFSLRCCTQSLPAVACICRRVRNTPTRRSVFRDGARVVARVASVCPLPSLG